MSTKMIIQQPGPVVQTLDSNQWSSGICDCCDDMAECCFAFWCMPCYACKTARQYGECLCLPLLNMCGCVPPITFGMRVSMRERYGITGTMCKDCAYASFCGPCSWCQMSKEIKRRTQPITLINARVTQ
ncbi:cornifelin homolog A-like [Scleropages formosus]|nr:cornifelin homolog A-like [Scleropages formosus]XP_018607678.1 cornifelin homolog A-like [Scleropages formosus]XP_029106990.1 cornifelin homolog A-like [Scleropages formosus]